MALKDMVKNAATEAVQKSVDSIKGGDILQGVIKNYTPISLEQAYNDFGEYLMPDETIKKAFKLIRDAMLFTDKRIIFFDRTGVTGSKTFVKSINYFSIVEIKLSTAGFRFDDSDMDIVYISTPNITNFNVQYEQIHLEFPRKFPVQALYTELQTIAYKNCLQFINK